MLKLFTVNGTHYGLMLKPDGWYIHGPYFGIRHKLENAPPALYPSDVIIEAKRIISEQDKELNNLGQCKY